MKQPEILFDNIKRHYQKQLPFVVYRKPNTNMVESLLQQDTSLGEVNNFSNRGFVFANFSGEKKILLPAENSISLSAEIVFDNPPKPKDNTDVIGNGKDEEKHIKLVEKGISTIKKGHLDKVVLSRKQLVAIPNLDPFSIFIDILSTYRNALCYLWYHPEIGTWMGASPEVFMDYKNNTLTTMSLAGTKPIIENQEVVWGEKEKKEQQFVTDYIISQLKTVGLSGDQLHTSELQTVMAGEIAHLKTTISAHLEDSVSLESISEALHPTPAVAGLPKQESIDFIKNNEGYDREFYTGFLGEVDDAEMKLFVNLRCMQLFDDKVAIYVGGGITSESVAKNEWEETVYKSKTMLNILTN
ncbi:chorismate-binding protein [Spongiivirga sp. MCCC 1A20706]|uniref:chorismate-binding protein n=1 Tax=Spongiivirga sp. MCCC 1A20706 TaxID=3160963 RepID=UPI003977DB05